MTPRPLRGEPLSGNEVPNPTNLATSTLRPSLAISAKPLVFGSSGKPSRPRSSMAAKTLRRLHAVRERLATSRVEGIRIGKIKLSHYAKLPRGAAASRLPRLRGFPGALRLRGFAASAASRLPRGAAASRLRGFRGFAASPGFRGFAASRLRGFSPLAGPRLPLH